MRTGFVYKAIYIGIILFFILISGCTKEKCTAPIESAIYLMKDYFPLNEGDQWMWEVTGDTIAEPFFDGDVNLGEPFVDGNKNGVYDFGEQYEDLNFNGEYDGPNDPWTSGIPYEDLNHNGHYDFPNGVWDDGESFADLDSNMTCNKTAKLIIGVETQSWLNPLKKLIGGYYFTVVNQNPHWFPNYLIIDVFSNDTLGLKWYGHRDPTSMIDYLIKLKPITIAYASTKIGDTVSYEDTSDGTIYSWLSIFEGVEDVVVTAGVFNNCLKFKTSANGWIGNMQKYNGTSYQWYAKNVGLVKSEGPAEGEYWLLKSAKVGDTNYP